MNSVRIPSPWQVLDVPESIVSLAPLAAPDGRVVDSLRDLLREPLAHELHPALGEAKHSLVLVEAAVAFGRLVFVGWRKESKRQFSFVYIRLQSFTNLTWLQENPADLTELREEHCGVADIIARGDARQVHDARLPPFSPPLHPLPRLKCVQDRNK